MFKTLLKYLLTACMALTATATVYSQTTVLLRDGVYERHEIEDFGLSMLAETDAAGVRGLLSVGEVGTTEGTVALLGAGDVFSDSLLSDNIPRLDGTNQVWTGTSNTFQGFLHFGPNIEMEIMADTQVLFMEESILRFQGPGGTFVIISAPYSFQGGTWELLIPDDSGYESAHIATREWAGYTFTETTSLGSMALQDVEDYFNRNETVDIVNGFSVDDVNLRAEAVIPEGSILVTDAGTAAVNGVYEPDGEFEGSPKWTHTEGGYIIGRDESPWFIMDTNFFTYLYHGHEADNPWDGGAWTTDEGAEPAPTVTLYAETIATREWVASRPDASNPVFEIQNWGEWTDLEIKAMSAGNVKFYYYHSPDPEKNTITGQVWDVQPRVWFTDSSAGGSNIRAWHLQNATQSIAAQLGNPANGYVGGWIVMIRGLDMTREELRNLSWSYALFDGASREEDAQNRQIWRPAIPADFQPDDYDPNN